MSEAPHHAAEEKTLPDGFLFVRFDQLLVILGSTIGAIWAILGQAHQEYTAYILGPLVILLLVFSYVARRQVRTFVREHGEVEITFTFSPDATRTKKNILFREVSEVIDDAIDRALDGKGQRQP